MNRGILIFSFVFLTSFSVEASFRSTCGKALQKTGSALKSVGQFFVRPSTTQSGKWAERARQLDTNQIDIYPMGYLGLAGRGEYLILFNEKNSDGEKQARGIFVRPVRLKDSAEGVAYELTNLDPKKRLPFWPLGYRFLLGATPFARKGAGLFDYQTGARLLTEAKKQSFLEIVNQPKKLRPSDLSWRETRRVTGKKNEDVLVVEGFPTGVKGYLRNLENRHRKKTRISSLGGYLSRLFLGMGISYGAVFHDGYIPLIHSQPTAYAWNGENYSRFEMWRQIQPAINQWDYLIKDHGPVYDMLKDFYSPPQEVAGKQESLEHLSFWENEIEGFYDKLGNREFIDSWLRDIKEAPLHFDSRGGQMPQTIDDVYVDAALLDPWLQESKVSLDPEERIPADLVVALIHMAEASQPEVLPGQFFSQIRTYENPRPLTGESQEILWDTYLNFLHSQKARPDQAFIDFYENQWEASR